MQGLVKTIKYKPSKLTILTILLTLLMQSQSLFSNYVQITIKKKTKVGSRNIGISSRFKPFA